MVGKEKYFRILGINPTSDQNAIKKAYRKQALIYHPDRNDSPDAHYRFIKITEAYEILTGQKRINTSTQTTYRPKTKEEIFAEKIAAAKERWKRQQAEEARKDREYYRRIAFGWKWKVYQVFAVYSAIFSVLLVCDYFLDGKEVSYPINHSEVSLDWLEKMVLVEEDKFHVDNSTFWHDMRGNSPIKANYSYLFGDMKSISVLIEPLPYRYRESYSSKRMWKYNYFEGKKLYTTMSYESVYGAFPILHLFFFVPLLSVIFKRPNLRFSIWRLVSIWIIFPVVIFFTFNNDRIYHLMDLIKESI
ncbi:MAG: DnaJ domain-containing protein [Crocinitomicaceae bacterium]|nr:DnaJ domain-containing protein [Crocinitomicaceae bacterium]